MSPLGSRIKELTHLRLNHPQMGKFLNHGSKENTIVMNQTHRGIVYLFIAGMSNKKM